MDENKRYLISHLASNGLANRYENCTVLNCDPVTGQKRRGGGALSVVFQATDTHSGDPVLLKFFDPDLVAHPEYQFRLDLFGRESDLLQALAGAERTAQIVQPRTNLNVQFKVQSGQPVNLTFHYLVTEWLEEDVQQYFLNQQNFSDQQKLEAFREICLAVFALHGRGIAHRDLKPDNIRMTIRNGRRVCVAIDLGTAAHFMSQSIGTTIEYSRPVGARAWAPIEAFVGLSGVRDLGIRFDYYALGCLLYELFHPALYYVQLQTNSGYMSCFGQCEAHMVSIRQSGNPTEKELLSAYDWILRKSIHQVEMPKFEQGLSAARPGLLDILNRMLTALAHIDYKSRTDDPNKVIRLIDSGLRILENQKADEVARDRRRIRRERREAKLARWIENQAKYRK